METDSVEVYGRRVRQARLMRDHSCASAAAALRWSSSRLSQVEDVECSSLPWDEFQRLVHELEFPAGFFLSSPVTAFGPGDLVMQNAETLRDCERQKLEEKTALVGDLLSNLDAAHPLPPVQVERCPKLDPRAAAAAVRKQLGLEEDEQIGDLTYLIECHGVPVISRPRLRSVPRCTHQEEESAGHELGLSAWVGAFNERPLISTEAKTSWENIRWELARQLGHIVLHTGGEESVTGSHERDVDQFAAEFLAPMRFVKYQLPSKPSLASFLSVKSHWGISIRALVENAHQTGLITAGWYMDLRQKLATYRNVETGLTFDNTELGWQDRLPEKPRLLTKWMEINYGTSSAKQAIGTNNLIWPRDILAEFTFGQRGRNDLERTQKTQHRSDTSVARVK